MTLGSCLTASPWRAGLSAAVLAIVLVALPAANAAAPHPASTSVATLSPDQLTPGQKAVVRTVFEGSKIEEFQAEIVGVLKGGRSEGDMILARATAGRALQSGIALGMSGSPMYVDGKLVGAVSGLWPFSKEPIFSVTPIAEMLNVLQHKSTISLDNTAGPAGIETGASTGITFGQFRWDDGPSIEGGVSTAPTPTSVFAGADAATGLVRPMLPLACGGLNPAAMEYARRSFAPLGLAAVPGGRSKGGGPAAESLEPGSAVAIDLLTGDLQLSAIGTVTWRAGDQILIFGHPLFQSGAVNLPLATAEITTIISNQQASFKLGTRGRSAGVVTQDRRAAVAGVLGGSPRMLPVSVAVTGRGDHAQTFHFESIEDRTLAPTLVAIATTNSMLESGGTGANQTMRWTLSLFRNGVPPLVLSDVEVSESPPGDVASGILSPLRFLFNNPFGRLALDSIAVRIDAEPGREQWTVRSLRVLNAAVRPGQSARLAVELERWRGPREVREFSLAIPEELPDGRYTLWIGGGTELSRYEALHLPGRYRPTSLDDAWRRLSNTRPSEGLYAALFARAPEITTEGKDYPELPISALALMSSEQSIGDRSRRGDVAKLEEKRLPLDGMTRGELLVQVTVDSKAP